MNRGSDFRTGKTLHELEIATASRLIARRELSPVALTAALLERTERLDPTLHCFLYVAAERALAQARDAEKEIAAGRYRGPLHGIPFGLKDVFDTAGIPTTGNSPAYRDRVPSTSATVVQRLERAGAVLIGKQATHELTYGGVALDLPWPAPANPWDRERDTGGSSSGAGAAVAAGLCLFALGTDTGGSIRNPAAHCGIVGLKPTFGRVSRTGVMPNSYSLDHCGPLTRTVRDCAMVLDAIAGHDPLDPASADVPVHDYPAQLGTGLKGIRIGLVRHLFERDMPASEEIRRTMAQSIEVLKELGARIEPVEIAPLNTYATTKATIQLPEVYTAYRSDLERRPDDFGPKFRARVMAAKSISGIDYVAAQEERRRLTAAMKAAMQAFDVLVTAGPFGPPPRRVDADADWTFNKPEITVPFSMTGFPALSICNGFLESGLPSSMQIVARPFDEAMVLRVAHAFEQATSWHERRPPV